MSTYEDLCEECKRELAENKDDAAECNNIIAQFCDFAVQHGLNDNRFFAQKCAYLESLL
jgi:hypothetical protein